MKIFLSKKWQYELISVFCLQGLCIIFGVLALLKGFVAIFSTFLYGFITTTVLKIILLCSCYRFFSYVVVKNNIYTSYLFKKCLCVIDKAKPIYYVIFSASEGMFSKRKFIVLSNEPFVYEEKRSLRIFPWEKKPLIANYDINKQIALPYNLETQTVLEIDKWKSVKENM